MSYVVIPSGTSIPVSLYDGHTVAWYDYNELSTLTLTDASVSRWNDKLGSGHDLIQATGSKQPSWSSDGVLFDGVNDCMKTAAFTYVQPEHIYMVAKQVTWTLFDCFFGGNINNYGQLTQGSTVPAPKIYAFSGTTPLINNNLSMDTWGIIRVLFNSTNSKLQINNTTATIGNAGTRNMGGFTLASLGNALSNFANIQVKEIILRNVADTPTDEANIYNYLSNKYLGTNLGTKLVTLPVLSNNKYITYQKLYNDILNDGHTVAWYDYNALSTLTLTDASVSQWNDILGSGHDLIQATGSKQPKWTSDGVLFDGVNDYLKTTTFTYNQPEQIYMVAKQVTFKAYDGRIFDGYTSNYGFLSQATTSPQIVIYAGAGGTIGANSDWTLDTWKVVRVLFNHDVSGGSKIQINNNTAITGNVATNDMGGFTLAVRGGESAGYNSNIQVKEIILRNVADNVTDENTIYNYLRDKYFLNFTYPSVLVDGATVAWYVADASSNTMQLTDASVGRWNDILGSGHDLIQAIGSAQPSWSSDGILFDGVNDFMQTAAFTYVQPEHIYMVIKQVTWTYGDRIFPFLLQYDNFSGKIAMYSGNPGLIHNTSLGINEWAIVRCLYNGANSKLCVNNNISIGSQLASGSLNGFTIAEITGFGGLPSNIQVKEIILRNVADNATDETAIYNYLANKYSIT